MATMTDKDSGAHVEHSDDVRGDEGSPELTSSNLKITRDSYLENKKGILICLIVNMALFEFGLDQGLVNGFQAMPGFLKDYGYVDPALPGGMGISTTVQQLISSLVSAGMFVSTGLTGIITDKLGRRGGLWVAIGLMFISITIQIAAVSVGALYAGRLILGFSNGLFLTCSQLYMQETIPSNLRSLSYTFYQFWISFGALVGTVINNRTATILDRSSYRIPLGVLYIPAALLGIALFFLPETPRHLSSHGKPEEAHKALRFIRDKAYSDLQVKEEMAEINHSIEVDKEMNASVGYLEMFNNINLRRTLTCLGLGLVSAANGVPFITQYGIYFFMLSGDTNPFRSGVILLCVGLVGAMLSGTITGKVGKRWILMVGATVQSFCMLGVGLVYSVRGIDPTAGKVILAMAAIYLFTASGTTSPYSWQVAGEVPSQRLRGHTFGFASSVTYLMGWTITFTIPYFINPTALNWGAQYAYIWCGTNLLIVVYVYFVVPETNKRTLEEIEEMWNQNVPVRKWPQYQCTASLQSRLEAVQETKMDQE